MHFRLQTTESKIPWGESIRFALRSIAAEKLNASLTTLAVVIGSGALVLVVANGSTGRLYIASTGFTTVILAYFGATVHR